MRSEYDIARRRTLKNIQGHVTSDRPSRTFDFRTPGKGSIHAFSLSWQPGSLSIVGDLGELTLVHYHALLDLHGGLDWARSSDADYLLSKSDRQKVYDSDATRTELVRLANEGALNSLRGWRSERPRRDDDETDAEFAAAVADWRECRDLDLKSFQVERWPDAAVTRNKRRWKAPDGWELWNKIWVELTGGWGDAAEVLRAACRSNLRNDLASHLDSPQDAADLFHRLGLDDWYGEYRFDYATIAQITAVKWGADRALNWLAGEECYRWRDPLPGEVAALRGQTVERAEPEPA